jgi:hypothetical protein
MHLARDILCFWLRDKLISLTNVSSPFDNNSKSLVSPQSRMASLYKFSSISSPNMMLSLMDASISHGSCGTYPKDLIVLRIPSLCSQNTKLPINRRLSLGSLQLTHQSCQQRLSGPTISYHCNNLSSF